MPNASKLLLNPQIVDDIFPTLRQIYANFMYNFMAFHAMTLDIQGHQSLLTDNDSAKLAGVPEAWPFFSSRDAVVEGHSEQMPCPAPAN